MRMNHHISHYNSSRACEEKKIIGLHLSGKSHYVPLLSHKTACSAWLGEAAGDRTRACLLLPLIGRDPCAGLCLSGCRYDFLSPRWFYFPGRSRFRWGALLDKLDGIAFMFFLCVKCSKRKERWYYKRRRP